LLRAECGMNDVALPLFLFAHISRRKFRAPEAQKKMQ
jgi:hypothetical protein